MCFVLAIMTTVKPVRMRVLLTQRLAMIVRMLPPVIQPRLARGCDADIYVGARQAECRKDIKNGLCGDTITNFCGAVGSATVGNLFNDLCAGADYAPERRDECLRNLENPLCGDMIANFCGDAGAANTGTLFNPLCLGTAYIPERQTECRKNIGNGSCGDTITDFCGDVGAANTGTLFDDLCLGGGYTPERVMACGGDIADLPGGDASVCNRVDLSGVICGTGGVGGTIGSDSFAEICTDGGSATAIIDFNQNIERQKFCGDTRVENGCAGKRM